MWLVEWRCSGGSRRRAGLLPCQSHCTTPPSQQGTYEGEGLEDQGAAAALSQEGGFNIEAAAHNVVWCQAAQADDMDEGHGGGRHGEGGEQGVARDRSEAQSHRREADIGDQDCLQRA